MPEAASPSPVLTFFVMFGLITLVLGLIFVLSAVTRGWRALTSPEGRARASVMMREGVQRLARGEQREKKRSPRLNYRANTTNRVQERSPLLNAEKPSVQGSASVQIVQANELLMPRDLSELQKLIHAHALYARRPNKQIAIETAWGCTKGEGPEWTRAAALFDAVNPGLPKPPKSAAAVEEDLRMEPVPQ
jgi:hypothetical protein